MLLQYLAIQLCLILFRIDMCFGRIIFEDSLVSGCTTPDGQRGDCERLTRCKALSQKFKRWDQLSSYLCGFVGTEPKVCCPSSPLPRISRSFSTDLQTVGTAAFRHISIPRTNPSCVNDTSQGKPSFLPDDCGSSFSSNSRIIGGQEAEKGSWPWMVVIGLVDRRDKFHPKCGGTLVTEKHVITAAHCVTNDDNVPIHPKHFMVELGVYDLNKAYDPDTEFVGVDAIQIHEHFELRFFKNDIAVLRLNQSVLFSDNIAPICLPINSLRYVDLTGKTFTVIGFGSTSYHEFDNDVLMEVNLDIVDLQKCRWIYRKYVPITSAQLCAGSPDWSRDSCWGDSGGPLMILGNDNRYYLIGVVSFGYGCAMRDYPGVYVRVTEFLDWLTPKLAD